MSATKSTTAEVIVSAEEIKGLCATCNAASGCVIRKDCTEPIWFCEEFDDHVAVPSRSVEHSYSSREMEAQPNGGAGGLCSNCADRQYCANRTPDAAIWFCENYS